VGEGASGFMGVLCDGRCERKCNYVHRGAFRKSTGVGIRSARGCFAGWDWQWRRRSDGADGGRFFRRSWSGLRVWGDGARRSGVCKARSPDGYIGHDKEIAKERALPRSCGYVYSSIHIWRRKSIQELNTWANFFESTQGDRLWGSTAGGMQGVLHRTGFCTAFEFVAERLGRGAWSEVPRSNVFTPMPATVSSRGLAGGVLQYSVASPLLDGGWGQG